MITAAEARKQSTQNKSSAFAKELKASRTFVERGINSAVRAGNKIVQVNVPYEVAGALVEELEALGYTVCAESVLDITMELTITW